MQNELCKHERMHYAYDNKAQMDAWCGVTVLVLCRSRVGIRDEAGTEKCKMHSMLLSSQETDARLRAPSHHPE